MFLSKAGDFKGEIMQTPHLASAASRLWSSIHPSQISALLACAWLGMSSSAIAQSAAKPSTAAPTAAKASAKAGYTIERIEARLYHHGTGKFSPVINDDMPLFNTIIGEGGAAGEPAEATFVTVVVSGSSLENAMSHVLLEVTQSDGSKTRSVLRQRAGVGFLKENQKQSQVGFWLYDTTCGTFKITARLGNERFKEPRGVHPAEYGKPVTKTLVFQCGE